MNTRSHFLQHTKQFVTQLYQILSNAEKKAFWLGVGSFFIGFTMFIRLSIPPTWLGWESTKGNIEEAIATEGGIFSGGGTTFKISYTTLVGQTLEGYYKITPVVMNTMKGIKVYYQKDNPSVFYVHNPTLLIISLTLLFLGFAILVAFFLYSRDKEEFGIMGEY
jgi:hypothetical protein